MRTLRDRLTTGIAALALLANSVGMSLPFILTQRVAAATVNVCDTGCDHTSIQSAIDSASSGDTIVVGDGTYNENVVINKNGIILRSENGAGSTTINPASGRAINFPASSGVVRDGVTIEGFTIVGNPGQITVQTDSNSADGIYNSANLTYRNLVINANGGFGLGLFDVNGITIDNVQITGATTGVEAIGVANLTMTGSSITGSTNTGFNIWSLAGYETNNSLTFANNTFSGNKTGLKLVNAGGVAISGGTISGGGDGIISQGSTTTVDGVAFDGIQSGTYLGIAISGFGGYVQDGAGKGTHAANDLTVKNSTFTNIGRIGILVKGTGSTVLVEGITYTGKGAINGLDYGVEFGAGGKGTVKDSTISNNKATASDSSTSAGILVTEYYGTGTQAVITGNTFSGNTTAIAAGYNNSDESKITVSQNNIAGNTNGITASASSVEVDAEENWWGHTSGPSSAGPGSGDSVSAHVTTFSPWLCAPAPSALTTTDGICDDTAPIVEIISPTTNAAVNGIIDVLGTVTDDQELSHYTIYLYPGSTDLSGGGVPAGWISVPGWQQTNTSADHVDVVRTLDTTSLSEGEYQIRLAARDAAGNRDPNDVYNGGTSSVHVIRFTVDRTAPTTPTITAPGANTWHQTAPIVNSWTAATDDNGIAYYQIAYNYDDGHSFGGTNTCAGDPTVPAAASGFVGCRDVNGLSRNHQPTLAEQGGVTIWVRAVDNAGNVGSWSTPRHYFYDHEAPVTDINIGPVVDGVFTVSGDASDNLRLNRVYVQLVSRVTGLRCGGTTISFVADNTDTSSWSRTYDLADLGANCPEGEFAAHVEVVDMAGNRGSAGWTKNFLVSAPETPVEYAAAITSPTIDDEEFPEGEGSAVVLIGNPLVLGAYDEGATGGVQWAVRQGECNVDSPFIVAGNVNGFNNPYTWENGVFDATVDTTGWTADTYCFVFNPNGTETRLVRWIQIAPNLGCDTETCPDEEEETIIERITSGGNVLGVDSDGLTNTGTQNGGLLVLIATSLMAIALATLRRKQEN